MTQRKISKENFTHRKILVGACGGSQLYTSLWGSHNDEYLCVCTFLLRQLYILYYAAVQCRCTSPTMVTVNYSMFTVLGH